MPYNRPVCNCPDAANKRRGNPGASSISEQVSSDWSLDFNGIRANGGYCIHEISVIRVRKEISQAFPLGTPTDIRTPPAFKIRKDRATYKLQKPNTLGDDFS